MIALSKGKNNEVKVTIKPDVDAGITSYATWIGRLTTTGEMITVYDVAVGDVVVRYFSRGFSMASGDDGVRGWIYHDFSESCILCSSRFVGNAVGDRPLSGLSFDVVGPTVLHTCPENGLPPGCVIRVRRDENAKTSIVIGNSRFAPAFGCELFWMGTNMEVVQISASV